MTESELVGTYLCKLMATSRGADLGVDVVGHEPFLNAWCDTITRDWWVERSVMASSRWCTRGLFVHDVSTSGQCGDCNGNGQDQEGDLLKWTWVIGCTLVGGEIWWFNALLVLVCGFVYLYDQIHAYQFALALPFRGPYSIVIILELPCVILRVHILIFCSDEQ